MGEPFPPPPSLSPSSSSSPEQPSGQQETSQRFATMIQCLVEKNNNTAHTENPNVSEKARQELIAGVDDFIKQVGSQDFSEPDAEMVLTALELTLEAHIGQKPRPDGKQYALHPIGVATSVMDVLVKPDPRVVVIALLHDTVEDQAETLAGKHTTPDDDGQSHRERALDYIKTTFGETVADAVGALSNPEPPLELSDLPSEEAQAEKNAIYRQHVVEIASHSPEVLLVKLFDFNDNALRLGEITDGKEGAALAIAQTRRTKLSKKYLPVVDVFIEKLQNPDVVSRLKPDQLVRLRKKLEFAKSDMSRYLGLAV